MLKKGLEEAGHSVGVIFPYRNLFTKLLIGGVGKILDLFNIGIIYRQFIIKNILKCLISKYCKTKEIDVINAEDIVAFFSIFEMKKKVPIALTVHGELAQEMESAGHIKGSFERNHFLKMEKKAYESADCVVAVDTRLKNHVEKLALAAEQKLSVIQNFMDVKSFQKEIDSLDKKKIRRELKIDTGRKLILVPRRLVLKCGIIYAVKASEILKKKYNRNNFLFLIVGDGPEKDNLNNYIQTKNLQGDVVLKGSVEYKEMVKFYKMADIVLVPSINVKGYIEATSLSVLEAMSAQVPVIASNIGGLAEIIENKKTGILTPEKSSEHIAESILKLSDNENFRTEIVGNASNYVLKNHSYLDAAQVFIDLYKK
ncbi:MAG: glycosyltransferase family 4 protein [Candidatus Aureabacteria bacterium]|nr:glycosyltransferase family 4 protein [Candidatus Auribacterota bacterium]